MTKRRLDTLLVDRGLAESREKAQALVMAGQVRVDERPAAKPGVLVPETVTLAVDRGPQYVGRGGDKLKHALHTFGLDVQGLVCADIGASTGGFTDCLLQHGAARVYAIDVGRGQLDWRLRNDARVVVMEGVNARTMGPLPEPVDFLTVDVSFISLRLVLPVVAGLMHPTPPHPENDMSLGDTPRPPAKGLRPSALSESPEPAETPREGASEARGSIVTLFKPQFEARKAEVPHGGVIRDPQLHSVLIGQFAAWCVANGFRLVSLTSSPILGSEGNREFLFWLRFQGATRRAE